MPDLEWSLLCEYCLIDAAVRLSIMGIFEQMLTPQVPAHQPMLFVVSRWRSEPKSRAAFGLRRASGRRPSSCSSRPEM